MPWATSSRMAATSAGRAGRLKSSPITLARTAPWPTMVPMLTAACAASSRSRKSRTGSVPPPSTPTSSVVIPWAVWVAASGIWKTCRSEWLCRSMNPGATTLPRASITRSPARGWRPGATDTMRSPSNRTSARRAGVPVPSINRPPRIRRVEGVAGWATPPRHTQTSAAARPEDRLNPGSAGARPRRRRAGRRVSG